MASKIYNPYDDATQMLWYIDRYPKSFTRVPSAPLIERPLTLSERTGPADLVERLHVGTHVDTLDLAEIGKDTRAVGQLIQVTGSVQDEDGSPIPGAVIELWQANSAGKYVHEMDHHQAPVDGTFTGEGRIRTDENGEYSFFSIKPGAYPVLESGWWWRPPHIHFSILGTSWMERFITQIFFPGEPLNETDLLLNGVPGKDVRQRLIFDFEGTSMGELNALHFRRDFVLRGGLQTPQLD